MRSEIQYISDLLYKYCSGEVLSDEEQSDLNNWLNVSETNSDVLKRLQDTGKLQTDLKMWSAFNQEVEDAWVEFNGKVNETQFARPVHRLHFLRTAWFRYAAAVIIVFGIGSYLYVKNQKESPSVTQTNPVPVQNDVAPGSNRATLTLADGKEIILDKAIDGTIAQQDNATITKSGDQIKYSPSVTRLPVTQYNTMSTPRGGQYQLALPDGSQVWLNAESSITYPTAFATNERRVTITGEAYFEVAKDKTKKFIVSVANKQDVEVLGTHFNINAYKDEESINTTLLEGSVKLTNNNSVHTSLTLKPGQQGQLSGQKLSLAANPNVERVIAWKNGVFNFNNADLQTVMRQLERWYDIQVSYEGDIPEFEFKGKLPMNLQLSQVLTILRKVEVKYRIEGRKLIVSP